MLSIVNFGFLYSILFKTRSEAWGILSLLIFGVISLLVYSHIWAFFSGFGITFHTVLLLINLFLVIYNIQLHKLLLKKISRHLQKLDFLQKGLFSFIFFLVTIKSTLFNSYFDNESYYIQTINWLNEFGFVKGLASFNIFLAQTSGWHILQSAFSFHFLQIELNDLNGLFLLILNFLAIRHFYNRTKPAQFLVALPLLNWALLEFCKVPSPDFGILFFLLISVLLFYENYKAPKESNYIILLLIFLSAFLIKITAFGLIIFPLVALYQLKAKSKFVYIKSTLLVLFFLGIWISKNLIISGYPFYPSNLFSDAFVNLKHQIPESLYELSFSDGKRWSFFASKNEINNFSSFELFWKWFAVSKENMVINLFIFFSLVAFPFCLYRYNLKKAYVWLYFSFVLQLIFVGFTSPQPRFVIHYLVLFSLILFSLIQFSNKFNYRAIGLSQILVGLLIVFPYHNSKIYTDNKKIVATAFYVKNFVFPKPNSSISIEYNTHNLGNLNYNSPSEGLYFWVTGNCQIPCINQQQIITTALKTKHIPQLKDSTDLSKGFYSKALF